MPRNRYGLPEEALDGIGARDTTCVYCHKRMMPSGSEARRKDWATIEHFNRLPPWSDPRTVGIACWSCNSSRGALPLRSWFAGQYCRDRGIAEESVAEPVRIYLREFNAWT